MLSIFSFTLSHVSPKEMAKDSSPTRSMMDRRSRAMWLNARSSSSIGRVTVPSYFFSSESKSTAEDSAMSANTGIFLRRRLHLSLSSLLMVSVIVFAVTCSRVCSSRSIAFVGCQTERSHPFSEPSPSCGCTPLSIFQCP